MWDTENGDVFQSLTIPRAVCVLASGRAVYDAECDVLLSVESGSEHIVQSPFMTDNAKTLSFRQTVTLTDDVMHYAETTMVDIYGKLFEHTDANTLTREG